MMANTNLDAALLQELALVGLPMDAPIPDTPFSGDSKDRPRKRTLIACDLCKVRHIKCDGSGKNPCTSCNNLKAECKYTTPTTKRGPKRIQKRATDSTPASMQELVLAPIAEAPTPKHDWAAYLDMFNVHIKPMYGNIFAGTMFPGNLEDIEKALSSGFSAKQIQRKFLSLAMLTNGAMLAKNAKLAEQLSSEANFMIGGLIGSPSFDVAIGLLLLGSYYCVGVGDFVRGSAVNALAYQITEILDVTKIIKSVNGYMVTGNKNSPISITSPSLNPPPEEALASLKARLLSKMIMNTPDAEDREYFLSKALKLPSSRMELFFVLHSYIVAKARDPLPPDQTQATASIFNLFTWVEKADGIVRDVENSVESPSWVGAMMRTMLDSCKVCLLHKMGLRDEAITLAEKTRAIIEKEMTAKHYGIGYQCATVAISKVYEQLNNPELLQNFLHTMEYVADVFVSMKLKLNETKEILNHEISASASPNHHGSSVVELPSSSSSSPQILTTDVLQQANTTSSLGSETSMNSNLPLGLDNSFLYMIQNEDPNLFFNAANEFSPSTQANDFSNLDSMFQTQISSADAIMGLDFNPS